MLAERQDALVVDMSCYRVSQGNASASKVVNTMKLECNKVAAEYKRVVCITVNGDGIHMKVGSGEWKKQVVERKSSKRSRDCAKEERRKNKLLLSSVISEATRIAREKWGQNCFIYVVAYHLLFRGISPRSDDCAPTHIICALTKGMSICESVQAFGRASGMQKSLLETKGYDHVTILCTADDYGDVKAYLRFMEYVDRELRNGKKLHEIISSESRYPAECRFVRKAAKERRPIGPAQAGFKMEGVFESPSKTKENAETSLPTSPEVCYRPLFDVLFV